jgi:hypothetical protein
MKTLLWISFISLLLLITSCSKKKNNLFEHYKDTPEQFGEIIYDSTQTLDSIVTLDADTEIETTGMEIYRIITKGEKRKQDLFKEQWLKNPSPYNPETRTITVTQTEELPFTIFVYDSTGDEIAEPVNDTLSAGEYNIDYSVFSSFPPGKYYFEIYCFGYQSVKQFIVREKYY